MSLIFIITFDNCLSPFYIVIVDIISQIHIGGANLEIVQN